MVQKGWTTGAEALFATTCLVAAAAVCMLQHETAGKELADTVEEISDYGAANDQSDRASRGLFDDFYDDDGDDDDQGGPNGGGNGGSGVDSEANVSDTTRLLGGSRESSSQRCILQSRLQIGRERGPGGNGAMAQMRGGSGVQAGNVTSDTQGMTGDLYYHRVQRGHEQNNSSKSLANGPNGVDNETRRIHVVPNRHPATANSSSTVNAGTAELGESPSTKSDKMPRSVHKAVQRPLSSSSSSSGNQQRDASLLQNGSGSPSKVAISHVGSLAVRRVLSNDIAHMQQTGRRHSHAALESELVPIHV